MRQTNSENIERMQERKKKENYPTFINKYLRQSKTIETKTQFQRRKKPQETKYNGRRKKCINNL